jgi:hypothetical protein
MTLKAGEGPMSDAVAANENGPASASRRGRRSAKGVREGWKGEFPAPVTLDSA